MGKIKKTSKIPATTVQIEIPKVSFDWSPYLYSDVVKAAPVTLFKGLSISNNWDSLVKKDLKIEVHNPDAVLPSDTQLIADCFWIASVIQIEGFFICLRWEGYENDDEFDFWMHIYDPRIHHVGYSQSNNKYLVPPKNILNDQNDWKSYLRKHLIDKVTLPINFREQISYGLRTNFRKGLKLEAIDINRVSAVRPVVVVEVKGTRVKIGYDSTKQYDFTNSLWCDQKSSLIHPVGWAQLVGHELKSTKLYAENSLRKVKTGQFEENDADFSYFPHLYEQMKTPYILNETAKFEKDMRVEVIDALNMKTVSVASVYKKLRYDYLMIGIDGLTSDDGSDAVCYHRSDCLPVNYCRKHKIQLEKPENYKKNFNYSTYLEDVGGQAAPECLFKDDLPDPEHCFQKGMFVESVDLMEPHLICPAYVKQVAGKLIKISFCGWEESYDQWIDFKSPEIYPIGYCFATDYMLETPKEMINNPLETSQLSSSKISKSSSNQSIKRHSSSRGIKKKVVKSTGKSMKKIKEINEARSNDLNLEAENSSNEKTIFNPTKEKAVLNPSNQEIDNVKVDEIINESSIVDKETRPSILPENVNNKEEQLKSPHQWSVEDVQKFWNENGFEEFSQIFVDNEIDGSQLIKIPGDGLFKLIGHKLGPSLKMFNLLKVMKKKFEIN